MRTMNENETLLLEPAPPTETPPAASHRESRAGMRFDGYEVGGFYDEMFARQGEPRAIARRLLAIIESLPDGEMLNRQKAAEQELLQMGITFNVYGGQDGVEKIFPFDIVPRIVGAAEWKRIERGLKQRIHALNLFIDDIYHQQKILKDGVIPREIIYSAKSYRRQCEGWNPPRGIWCHITGTDLVRHEDGRIYVLEDNLRCPSGVSYVLENRRVMKGLLALACPTHLQLSELSQEHAGVSGGG